MYVHRFQCMASPCEIQIDCTDPILGGKLGALGELEAVRIEKKFSRYLPESIVGKMNAAKGKPVEVDEETGKLIDYAFECFEISDGLIDITSGVLRTIWKFTTPFEPLPNQKAIDSSRLLVGLNKVKWTKPYIQMKKDMEIDLGGIVKEYAVDRCLEVITQSQSLPCLVNFGGDLAVNRSPLTQSWQVRIEGSDEVITPKKGGLATSGDARRYLQSEGRIFSHILNPKTGWAVESPYVSITVEAENCTAAGILATLSHLQPNPKAFLDAQNVRYWLVSV